MPPDPTDKRGKGVPPVALVGIPSGTGVPPVALV